jgi:hypothetical protein
MVQEKFEILEIKARGNIQLCCQDHSDPSGPQWKPIDPDAPIWKKGIDVWGTGGSRYPAAFWLGGPAPGLLEVRASIPGAPYGGEYKIEGRYRVVADDCKSDVVLFRGSGVPDLDHNTFLFEAFLQEEAVGFFRFSGENLLWHITGGGQGNDEGFQPLSVYLEIYWLYGEAQILFRRGVPVEVLRQVADTIDPLPIKAGMAAKNWLVETVVRSCFLRNPPRYNIGGQSCQHVQVYNGSWNSLSLLLSQYLDEVNHPYYACDCYDKAAVLQVYVKAVGFGDIKYCRIDPFGYLKLTHLIGRGLCNNPKYGKTGAEPVVDPGSEGRSFFYTHAFCCLAVGRCAGCSHNKFGAGGNEENGCPVLDACVGPHIGDEDFENYVERAIDLEYPDNSMVKPGTADHIYCYNGVIQIGNISAIRAEPDLPHTGDFRRVVGYAQEAKAKMKKKFVVRAWPDPRECRALGPRWRLLYEEIVAGSGETMKTWKLRKGGESINIRLYVSAGNSEYALNRFLAIGSLTDLAELPFQKGPKLGHFSAKFEGRDSSRYFWIFYNLVFDVTFHQVTFRPERLLKWLNRKARCIFKIKKSSPKNLCKYLPEQAGITCSNLAPARGETVTIKFEPEAKGRHKHILLDFIFKEVDGLYLVGETDDTLKFRGRKESENTLVVTAVDKDTLLCNSREMTIKVGSQGN